MSQNTDPAYQAYQQDHEAYLLGVQQGISQQSKITTPILSLPNEVVNLINQNAGKIVLPLAITITSVIVMWGVKSVIVNVIDIVDRVKQIKNR